MIDIKKKDLLEKSISLHEFYFETPLYTIIQHNQLEGEIYKGEVDGFSPNNKIDTTYTIISERVCHSSRYYTGVTYILDDDLDNVRIVKLTCKRKGEVLYFIVLNLGEEVGLVKVGQYPSLADIQFSDLSIKYSKVMDKENMFLLKRAVGLVAHGTGIGSFVYLRRIFEGLIGESFATHSNEIDVPINKFKNKSMEKKVAILKDFLPEELSEMKSLYGILSRGVHELTEEECLKYFPALKLSIELILDAKIEADEKANRAAKVKSQIAAISSEIGGKK